MSDEWVAVAKVDDVKPGASHVVHVGDVPVALVRDTGGTLYAIRNVCPHRGGPVGEGPVDGSTITCPWHAWQFDLKTGGNVLNPLSRVRTFEVKEEDGVVRVRTTPEDV